MPNEISGIKKGAIIKAQDIYNRYSRIIGSLIDTANRNIETLISQITEFKRSIAGSEVASAFSNLETTSYHESDGNQFVLELTNLSTQLANLEKTWFDADNLDNSAHGGVEEYKTDYTDYDSRKSHPLHVIKGISINDNKYPADGRVNQSDFIGAYHFQNTVESLYSIATRLRDIQIQLNRSSGGTAVNLGQDNPYRDLKTIKDNPDYISSNYINVGALSVELIPFHDWMLNSNLNGRRIDVGDDDPDHPPVHGWVKTNEDPNVRYPNSLTKAMRSSQYFINKNRIGRQITRNLRNRTSEVSAGGINEPAKLSNFYYNDNTSDKYGRQPEKGIANEYLTLKFGTGISGTGTASSPIGITSYSTPSAQLSNYFQKIVNEQYTPGSNYEKIVVPSTNVIRSKERGKKHIVCAATVNNMFKKMNEMLVQISSSLYGKYQFTYDETEISNYGSGNPIGGLGYPEIMSWYSGGESQGTIRFLNVPLSSITSRKQHTYQGSIRNDSFVAKEDTEWESIKAGYPWMTNSYRNSQGITEFNQLYDKFLGSTVPMSYNRSQDDPSESVPGTAVKKSNLTTSNMFGTSENGVYTIENAKKNGNANKQVFTRYCISHPTELSDEKNITSTFYTKYRSEGAESTFPILSALDINAKYMFMPYMMYLDYWYSTAQNNQKVGNFLNRDIYVSKPTNKFYSECGMPVQCINRNSIWDGDTINGGYNNISVALVASSSRNGNPKYLIGRDYTINRIDYQVKGILTVNEANHTHEGYSRLRLSVDNSPAMVDGNNNEVYLEIPYKGDGNDTGSRGRNNFNGISSSIVYFGKNNYDVSTNNYYHKFNNDAIDSIVYDRYKFNDFYDDYDLLTKRKLTVGEIDKYFSCGGDNLYLGGNKTMFWNWIVKKPLTSGPKQLKIYPYFDNIFGKYSSEVMIQGNFFFSANHSDVINVTSNASGTIRGDVHYKYVPIPNPVTITEFTVDPTSFENNMLIKGRCNAWWNNLAGIEFIIKFNNVRNTSAYLAATNEYIPAEGTNYRYPTNRRPFAANQVESKVAFSNETNSMNVSYEWNSTNDRFEFNILCSCPFPDDFSGNNLTVDCKFTNEDGGYRSITGQSVPTVQSPNFSQSYSFLVPYTVHKTATNVKVGSFISDYTQISTRALALNAINPSSVSSNVEIIETSILGWGSNDDQLTVSNSDDFSIMTSSDTPVYNSGTGGWVNVKTKVKITSNVSSSLTDGQKIIMNVNFGSIYGGSGDGVSIFFGDENTTLKDASSFADPMDVQYRQPEPTQGWDYYNTNIDYNKEITYGLLQKHFDNIPNGITQSNVISKGGKVLVSPKQVGERIIGEVPANGYINFNKIFTVHKQNNECYIVNNMFIDLGGDKYTNLDNVDWGAFGIQINHI